MNCEICRETLLQSERSGEAVNGAQGLSEHLRGCGDCRQLAEKLARLESNWRDLPLPAQADSSRQAFLERLAQPASPAMPAARPRSRRGAWIRWTVAAIMMIGVGLGALVFWPSSNQVAAQPDVLDELIDWTLAIGEAPSPVERQRLYHEKHNSLKKALRRARLNQREHELAERLLDNGAWMAENVDPMEELDRFQQVADSLLDHVHDARQDDAKSNRFAKQLRKVHERGIEKGMQRIRNDKLADPSHKVKYHKLIRQNAMRAEKIREMSEQAPELTKKELRRALEWKHKRSKPKDAPVD